MTARALALPLAALVLAARCSVPMWRRAGASYAEVQGAADPCRRAPSVDRPVPPELEPLAERVVLIGLDETACPLGVSRERLVLALPSAEDRRALAAELGSARPSWRASSRPGWAARWRGWTGPGACPRPRRCCRRCWTSSTSRPGAIAGAGDPGGHRRFAGAHRAGAAAGRAGAGRRSAAGRPGRLATGWRTSCAMRWQQAAQAEIRARLLDRLPGGLRGLLGE